jgi:peroxiredoxin
MVLTQSYRKLKPGDQAPYFILMGTDDREHAVKSFLGKPLLVVFMCNHCPYVRAKLPSMIKLASKFFGKVNVVGINSNDPRYEGEGMDNMKKFVKESRMNFHYLIDDSQKVARAYGAVCTPDCFLFDAEGRLAYQGRLDSSPTMDSPAAADVMERNIEALLAGEKVKDHFLPSHGCSIKWKPF